MEPFNEKKLFKQVQAPWEQEEMLNEIHTKFFNISMILDCVTCEKCRLNGKVQVKGLATALKILFMSDSQIQNLHLDKQEQIALI